MIDFSSLLPQVTDAGQAAPSAPAYYWTDPSGTTRPGTAPGASTDLNAIWEQAKRHVASMLLPAPAQSAPRFQPTAIPGELALMWDPYQVPRPAPPPGGSFLHADPMFQLAVARRHALLSAPVPAIHPGPGVEGNPSTPGIGYARFGPSLAELHPSTPGLGHRRKGPGITAIHRGLGLVPTGESFAAGWRVG